MYIVIHSRQSAQISQKKVGINTCVLRKTMCPPSVIAACRNGFGQIMMNVIYVI